VERNHTTVLEDAINERQRTSVGGNQTGLAQHGEGHVPVTSEVTHGRGRGRIQSDGPFLLASLRGVPVTTELVGEGESAGGNSGLGGEVIATVVGEHWVGEQEGVLQVGVQLDVALGSGVACRSADSDLSDDSSLETTGTTWSIESVVEDSDVVSGGDLLGEAHNEGHNAMQETGQDTVTNGGDIFVFVEQDRTTEHLEVGVRGSSVKINTAMRISIGPLDIGLQPVCAVGRIEGVGLDREFATAGGISTSFGAAHVNKRLVIASRGLDSEAENVGGNEAALGTQEYRGVQSHQIVVNEGT